MTPPGGSRDDAADNDPRGEAESGRVPGDKSDGDDPRLRAMRAVWLAMREEEPPDRGMTELLAAARRKAEAMQPRPSAWQRLLAALRRPPALALATVMVLIAGAVLIGRRVTDERATGAATRSPPSEPGSAGAPGRRDAEPATAKRGGVLAQPPSTVTAPAPAHPTHAPGAPAVRTDPRSAPAPVSHAPASREPEQGGEDRGPPDRAPAMPAASASEQPAAGRAPQLGASAAVPSFDTAGASDARTPPPPPPPPETPAPQAAPDPGDLYQQCEAAARRGDCAAVRRLVGQIARTDPGYRARIAKDSPVGECLAR